MELDIAGASDRGVRRRDRPNQDGFFVPDAGVSLDDGVLLVVADGMGGAAGGERASVTALEALAALEVGDAPGSALVEGIVEANARVHALGEEDASLVGAGTTVVAALVRGAGAWVAHVGDSRAYRYRAGALERLTSDHSYVQEEIDAGRLSEEEAREHPRRNLITRSVGSREEVEVDVLETELREGDALLLCSDGLWGMVDDAGLAIALRRCRVARPGRGRARGRVHRGREGGGRRRQCDRRGRDRRPAATARAGARSRRSRARRQRRAGPCVVAPVAALGGCGALGREGGRC